MKLISWLSETLWVCGFSGGCTGFLYLSAMFVGFSPMGRSNPPHREAERTCRRKWKMVKLCEVTEVFFWLRLLVTFRLFLGRLFGPLQDFHWKQTSTTLSTALSLVVWSAPGFDWKQTSMTLFNCSQTGCSVQSRVSTESRLKWPFQSLLVRSRV